MRGRIGIAAVLLCAAVSVLGLPAPAGAISADPPALDFGEVAINTTETEVVTLTIDAGHYFLDVFSESPYQGDRNTCRAGPGGTVGPRTCKIKATFAPTETGNFASTLVVYQCPVGGGVCAPVVIPVQGTGVRAIAVNPDPLNFGDVAVGTTKTKTLTLTIDAGHRFHRVAFALSEYQVDNHTCQPGGVAFVGPGSCKVKVTFAPIEAGDYGGRFEFVECPIGGFLCPNPNTEVEATGVSAFKVRPDPLNFGDVAVGTTKTKTLTLTIDAGHRFHRVVFPLSEYQVDLFTCQQGTEQFVGPGPCKVKVTYAPTAPGDYGGRFEFVECPIGGFLCPNPNTEVEGTGVAVFKARPDNVNFGRVPLGTTKSKTVTVTIDAGYKFSSVLGVPGPPYNVDTSTCGFGGGAFRGPGTCKVVVSYTPTAPGSTATTFEYFECPVIGGTCLSSAIPLAGDTP